MTSKVKVRLLQSISQRLQESAQLTPPIAPLTTASKALSKRDRVLVEQELNILRLLTIVLVCAPISALYITAALQRLGSIDKADVEDAGKRFHVRHDVCAVLWSRLVGWNKFCELGEAESGQDRGDIGVVAEIEVEDLAGWESGFHA